MVCGGNYDWGSVTILTLVLKGLFGWEGERIGAFSASGWAGRGRCGLH